MNIAQQILMLLDPRTGQIHWNVLLYLIFFLALLSLILMPDKNLLATLLVAGVMASAVIAKLSLSVSRPMDPILTQCEFGMYLNNLVMFVFPILAAGIIRAKKKAKVVIPLILCAVLGFLFFFGYWFFVQNVLCSVWA